MEEQINEKISLLIEKGRNIADSGLAFLRKYIFLAILNAFWITHYFTELFSLPQTIYNISVTILIVPAFIFFIFTYVLYKIRNIDKTIIKALDKGKTAKTNSDNIKNKFGFFDLISLGKAYYSLSKSTKLLNASYNIFLTLGNPFLLTLLVIAYFTTIILSIVSFITFLFYIF